MEKRIMLKELHAGENGIRIPLLIRSAEDRVSPNNGKTYCRMKLSDGENEISASDFNREMSFYEKYIQKTVLMFVLDISEFNGVKTAFVRNAGACRETYSLYKFVPSAPEDAGEMFEGIMKNLDSLDHPLAELASSIYLDNKEKLLYYPAAKMHHHAVLGGLLWHSKSVACLAGNIGKSQKNHIKCGKIDITLLYIGGLLHDIGKLAAYDSDLLGCGAMNADGMLYSHSLLGMELVKKAAEESGIPEKDPDLTELLHMIASHHGDQGAIAKPATLNAMILAYADRIDAELNAAATALSKTGEGGITEYVPMLEKRLVRI